jgi:hypothetical protein
MLRHSVDDLLSIKRYIYGIFKQASRGTLSLFGDKIKEGTVKDVHI